MPRRTDKMTKGQVVPFVAEKPNTPRWKHVGKALLSAAFVALVTLCSLMVYFQMRKFFNSQTTIATIVDASHEVLPLPSLAFCPGLKYDKISELVWPVRIYNREWLPGNLTFEDTFPTERSEMDTVWDEYTHSADELFISITAQYQNWNYSTSEYKILTAKDLLNKEVGCLTMKEYGTPMGKCFSVDTLCEIGAALTLRVTLNLTQVKPHSVSPTVRQLEAFMGNTGYESGLPIHAGNLEPNTFVDLILYPKDKIDTDGDPAVTETEYHDCITKAVYAKTREISPRLCYHPSFSLVLGPELSEQLEPCPSEKDFFFANYVLMEAIMLPHGNHSCRKPKVFRTYDFTRQSYLRGVFLEEGIVRMFLSLGTTDVVIEQDYDLQDFYAIVATLGGSIGLFFGWSIYGFVRHTAKSLEGFMMFMFRRQK